MKKTKKDWGKISIKDIDKLSKKKKFGVMEPAIDKVENYFTKAFLYTNLTPNQISVLWIVLQLISSSFLILGIYWVSVVALIFFQLGFIIDGVDGKIARIKKIVSLKGIYIDQIGHYIVIPFQIAFLAIGVYRNSGNTIYLLAAIITIIAFLYNKALTVNGFWYMDKKQREMASKVFYGVALKNQMRLLSAAFEVFRIEQPLSFFFWGIVLNIPHIVVIVYSILYIVELFRKTITQIILLNRIDKKISD